MLYYLRNRNVKEQYPLLFKAISENKLEAVVHYDRALGSDFIALDIKSMNDLCAILSLAKASNEYCTGIYFNGIDLVISEKPYTLGE